MSARKKTATWCSQCGPLKKVDEDGCCLSCGATAMGRGADAATELLMALEKLYEATNAVVGVARLGDCDTFIEDPRRTPRPLAYKTLPTVGYLATVIAIDGLPYSAWQLHGQLTLLLEKDIEACRALLETCGFSWSARPQLTLVSGGVE